MSDDIRLQVFPDPIRTLEPRTNMAGKRTNGRANDMGSRPMINCQDVLANFKFPIFPSRTQLLLRPTLFTFSKREVVYVLN